MLVRVIGTVVVAGCLAGCATGYRPTGFGGGYSDIRLNETIYDTNGLRN